MAQTARRHTLKRAAQRSVSLREDAAVVVRLATAQERTAAQLLALTERVVELEKSVRHLRGVRIAQPSRRDPGRAQGW